MVPDMANLPATPPEVDQEAEQIRQAKAQMFQAALAAPTKSRCRRFDFSGFVRPIYRRFVLFRLRHAQP